MAKQIKFGILPCFEILNVVELGHPGQQGERGLTCRNLRPLI